MKAKRAKQQRKIMQMYQMHYSFREPYQILITSDCLRAIHAFSMPMQKFFENTVQGKVIPYISQCTLARVMEGYSGKGRDGRPAQLPPPTELPLRYCKHKDEDGQERGVISETDCLLELLSGGAKGNEQKKNKNHYILAVADWDEGIKDPKEREKSEAQRRKRRKLGEPDVDVRGPARSIPGVPIVYVKRSVMVLEEPSVATERAVRGIEKQKFQDGIGGAVRGLKRAREEDSEEDVSHNTGPKVRGLKKAKGPNPLSIRKKQPKAEKKSYQEGAPQDQHSSQVAATKEKRRRGKRGKSSTKEADGTEHSRAEGAEHDE